MHEDMRHEKEWLLREKYNGIENDEYRADCERLVRGEPLAYIIGHIPFLSTTISLDSHPLIPRTETEYWVENAIKELREIKGGIHVLDLCAGSGCIGVAVLKAIVMARVDFAEFNPRHHSDIEHNITQNGIDLSRAHIYGGDLFSEIPTSHYNAILTNPPYINPERSASTQRSVLEYEPHEALFGGVHGMELIERILTEAPDHLTSAGVLYIEHEPEQRDAIHQIAASLPYTSCETHTDQYGVIRYTRLTRAAHA